MQRLRYAKRVLFPSLKCIYVVPLRRLKDTLEKENRYNLRRSNRPQNEKEDGQKLGKALLTAAGTGNEQGILTLLANGADVNYAYNNGQTPLHAAVKVYYISCQMINSSLFSH